MITYVFLIKGLMKDDVEQNFATWLLWALLDLIAALSILFQGGNHTLPFFYAFWGMMIAAILLYKKQLTWSWFETLVVSLVIICVIVWALSGSRIATIASTTAVAIATFPQFLAAWKKPETAGHPMIWVGYTIANVLSLYGGKTWTVEERFYPGVCVVLCASMAILCGRKSKSSRRSGY